MSGQIRKGIYLLPNILTTAGLFSGFFAIVSSMNGKFEAAAIAIFVAMIFDGLDGRVARMTNTASEFGAEYDSMADIVSFGMAPALVVYNWALADLGKFGWLAAFIFVASGALRLARFNTNINIVDKRYFQGLPIPAAAAIIAGLVWVGVEYQIDGKFWAMPVAVLTIVVGLLMVSNFAYNSFKEVNWQGKVSFLAILSMLLVFVVVATDPALVLFLIFLLYSFAGPINTFRNVDELKLEHVVGDPDPECKDADFSKEDLKAKAEKAKTDKAEGEQSETGSAEAKTSDATKD